MSSKNLAWGVGGVVSLMLSVACSGTKINDVGDIDSGGNAGEPSIGGSAGSVGHVGGSAGSGAGGSSDGGDLGGKDTGGALRECFLDFNPSHTGDDENPLVVGPQNAVFTATTVATGVKNYADEPVFGGGSVWALDAEFPAVSTALATDVTISLPAEVASVPENLGQLYVTRRSCAGVTAAGHTLRIELWWELGGAIVHSPTEGLALGALAKGKTVWFEDATSAFVTGQPDADRPLNTRESIVLEHTFADDDDTDAGKIVLGLWLLEDYAFPTKLYVGNVTWD